jgi:Skp family chaperone for outer membrane proteins
VVSIVNLFDALDEKADAETRVDQMKKTYENESRTMQQEVERLTKEVDNPVVFAKNSPEHKKLQEELLEKATRLKVHDEIAQAKLMMELRMIPLDIYRKMSDAIRDYSASNGIALVFVADDTNALSSARNPQELMAMITMRKVVYAHPTFDITKSIIDRMNTQYKLGAGRKP